MKIKGLDGREHSWILESSEKTDDNRSKLHLRARELIKSMFPYDKFYEDVTLPGSSPARNKSVLYADFFLPLRKLMIEVNGRQHEEYVRFFHGDKANFKKSIARDKNKLEWCEINNIRLVYLNHNENDDEWRNKINDC